MSLPLPALTLRQLRYFVILARSSTFTEAAKTLAVTQPALTAAIQQIETLMGDVLLDRGRRQVTLTPAGEQVLPLAERLLNLANGSVSDMLGAVAQQRQTVRVGLIPSLAERVLPVLRGLEQAHADIHVEITDLPNSTLVQSIASGQLDLGIGVADANAGASTLRCEALFEDEFVAIVHRDDPLAAGRVRSLHWSALSARNVAVFVRGNVSDTLQGLERHGLRLAPAYRAEYTHTLYALVRNQMAVAILPSLYTLHLYDPVLRRLPLRRPHLKRQLALMRGSAHARSPAVELAHQWIRAHV